MVGSLVWVSLASSDLPSANWTMLSNAGDSPSSVYDHAMGVLSDGSVVVYGGVSVHGILDDTYKLVVSGSTATWTLHSNTGDSPGGLSGHAMAVLSDDTVVVYGGNSVHGISDDTYKLVVSGSAATWTLLSNTGDSPGRYGHAMAVLSDDTILICGGDTVDGISDETYQLVVSGSTATWTLLSNTGDSPGGRYDHAMAALSDDTVVLLGGEYEYDYEAYGGTYQLEVSGSTATWTLLSNTGDSPVVLYGQAMAVLSDGSVVVSASTGNVDATHQLVVSGSTAAWKLLSTLGDTPGARVYHTMAALGDGTAVVFGGLMMSTFTSVSDVYQLVVSLNCVAHGRFSNDCLDCLAHNCFAHD